jgi:hypothetical protein
MPLFIPEIAKSTSTPKRPQLGNARLGRTLLPVVSGKAIFLMTDFIHVATPALVECGTLCAQESSWLRLQRRIKATLRLLELVNRWA